MDGSLHLSLIKITPCRYAQRPIFLVILGLLKLTIKMDHQNFWSLFPCVLAVWFGWHSKWFCSDMFIYNTGYWLLVAFGNLNCSLQFCNPPLQNSTFTPLPWWHSIVWIERRTWSCEFLCSMGSSWSYHPSGERNVRKLSLVTLIIMATMCLWGWECDIDAEQCFHKRCLHQPTPSEPADGRPKNKRLLSYALELLVPLFPPP